MERFKKMEESIDWDRLSFRDKMNRSYAAEIHSAKDLWMDELTSKLEKLDKLIPEQGTFNFQILKRIEELEKRFDIKDVSKEKTLKGKELLHSIIWKCEGYNCGKENWKIYTVRIRDEGPDYEQECIDKLAKWARDMGHTVWQKDWTNFYDFILTHDFANYGCDLIIKTESPGRLLLLFTNKVLCGEFESVFSR